MKRWTKILPGVVLLLASTLAAAQAFPTKPIHIVVPYPAGGGTDIVARMLAGPLREMLGKPVIVDNKPGAGGALGAAEVARATADGYTLLMTAGAFVIAPSVLANVGYDPARDFTGVSQVAIVPLIVLTRSEGPLNTFADLIALAKKDGEKVSFASFGNATPSHLVGTAIQLRGGIKMTHVPYKGGMQAMPDILSGVVTVGILDAVSMTPFVKQGRLKALAVTGPKRLPALADTPTLVESGISFDAVGWHGVFAPAAVPPVIVRRLNEAFNKAAARPEVRERIVNGGSTPIEPPYTAEQWTEQYRREIGQWAELVRAGGIKVE
ncbi:MAG: tripartite tricarboxylate transporter substrate binding protein [Betaproteobacteria bacterium]|nr:MAG: tripartite tricarboxylate transporter substrate binding protein [Betaproteobacteria bacterium]